VTRLPALEIGRNDDDHDVANPYSQRRAKLEPGGPTAWPKVQSPCQIRGFRARTPRYSTDRFQPNSINILSGLDLLLVPDVGMSHSESTPSVLEGGFPSQPTGKWTSPGTAFWALVTPPPSPPPNGAQSYARP
jgi:hypothetical protein